MEDQKDKPKKSNKPHKSIPAKIDDEPVYDETIIYYI
jgi:hypothetical protein